MALIRNIAGIGMVNDVDTMKCDDRGCLDDMGPGLTGPVMYREPIGSGITEYQEAPVEPIVAATEEDPVAPAPVNVIPVGEATPEPSAAGANKGGVLLLAASMAILLFNKKGSASPLLYTAAVAALYFRSKK